MLFRVAVVDDESDFLKYVSELLRKEIGRHFDDVKIEQFTSGEALLQRHKFNPFDVVFLDIDMPNTTGFDVSSEIRKQSRECYIVFITSHSELVYDSMDFQPFNFVRKGDLKQFSQKLSDVIDKLTLHLKQHKKIVLFDKKHGRFSVPYSDVLYMESDDHYVRYYILGTKPKKIFYIMVRSNIGVLEKEFSEYDFVRIHKKYIVNLKHIFNLDMKNDLCIFKQDITLPMSRNLKHFVDEKFTEYLKRTT